MTTLVQDNPDLNRYEVFEGDELAGFSDYTRSAGTIAITHTEVDDRFEGRGLGSALARGVLDAARGDGLAVLPHCPFTAGYIRNHPDDYLDLVPQDKRSRFNL
jgi:uncharacterized protein